MGLAMNQLQCSPICVASASIIFNCLDLADDVHHGSCLTNANSTRVIEAAGPLLHCRLTFDVVFLQTPRLVVQSSNFLDATSTSDVIPQLVDAVNPKMRSLQASS
jgi:hypothetical protein